MLHKNARVEENAGLRESSYKTWSFTPANIVTVSLCCFLPSYLLWHAIVQENGIRDRQCGIQREYGIFPRRVGENK